MMILLADDEVSNLYLRLWVASDKEETEVGITVNCFLTNLNHLGNGIKTTLPYDEKTMMICTVFCKGLKSVQM